ncbi:MAG: hypothetical protein ACR2FO_07815 [Actinomycetota bacterium]
MRKRLGFTALAVVAVCLAIMPAAMAQAPAAAGSVMAANGSGDARALDLDVLGLARLTIAAADGSFEMNTQGQGSATTKGRAVGLCNLVTGGSDPLACTSGNPVSSSAPTGNGTPADACTVPEVNLPSIINVRALCAHSDSKVEGAKVTGNHTASLASLNVGLSTDIAALLKQLTDAANAAVATATGTATGAVTAVSPATAATLKSVTDTLTGVLSTATGTAQTTLQTVQGQLATILPQVTSLAEIKVLPAEVHLDSAKEKTAAVRATSSTVSIDLLKNPLTGALIHLEVTPSKAEATFNGDSGKANCHAEAALVHVKVANLLGGRDLIDVAPGANLLDLSKLLPLGDGLVGIKVASATQDSINNDSCRAEARGLELNVLKALNGGIALRVASTNAEIKGKVTALTLAAGPVCPDPKGCLPLTGGPVYSYMAGAFVLAAFALGSFLVYRRLSATA